VELSAKPAGSDPDARDHVETSPEAVIVALYGWPLVALGRLVVLTCRGGQVCVVARGAHRKKHNGTMRPIREPLQPRNVRRAINRETVGVVMRFNSSSFCRVRGTAFGQILGSEGTILGLGEIERQGGLRYW
jgi:hypothetical protein